MKQEELKFKIDQLRKDKIIYATEATATAVVCVLGYLFVNTYFEGPLKYWGSVYVVFVGTGYALFMGIGNALRLKRINELEKTLYS